MKTFQIIIIFTLELETKPFDISHGYSRPWKQHLAMHQRRAHLKVTTMTFLRKPKSCLPSHIALMPHAHYQGRSPPNAHHWTHQQPQAAHTNTSLPSPVAPPPTYSPCPPQSPPSAPAACHNSTASPAPPAHQPARTPHWDSSSVPPPLCSASHYASSPQWR